MEVEPVEWTEWLEARGDVLGLLAAELSGPDESWSSASCAASPGGWKGSCCCCRSWIFSSSFWNCWCCSCRCWWMLWAEKHMPAPVQPLPRPMGGRGRTGCLWQRSGGHWT